MCFCFVSGLFACTQAALSTDVPSREADTCATPPGQKPSSPCSLIATTVLERAKDQYARIKELVDDGTLPKSRLAEAASELADAEDDAALALTLYSGARIADMTVEQGQTMIAAAQRRVDRQAELVEDRRKLLDAGILARSDFQALEDELESRKRVLHLAQNRMQLLDDLRQMAEAEQRLAHETQTNAIALKNVMIRYDGSGAFNLSELTAISSEFQKRFHRALPVSAMGQTLLHESMGLDHHNRVDIALNPEQPEGIWLRRLLERLRIPYLGFRSAVAGAATAPHIHIGPGSTRLKLARR